jgi:hypothetical protein
MLIVGETHTMRNSSPSKLTLWMEYSFADLDKRVELEELSMIAIPEPDVIDMRRECLNHCLLQFPVENRELIIEYYRKEGRRKIAHRLDAVINFSALQSSPLERVDFMKSSDHISVKYFFDFYISYRREI